MAAVACSVWLDTVREGWFLLAICLFSFRSVGLLIIILVVHLADNSIQSVGLSFQCELQELSVFCEVVGASVLLMVTFCKSENEVKRTL